MGLEQYVLPLPCPRRCPGPVLTPPGTIFTLCLGPPVSQIHESGALTQLWNSPWEEHLQCVNPLGVILSLGYVPWLYRLLGPSLGAFSTPATHHKLLSASPPELGT